ncbi:MAG: NADH-quinone oxidoreductase subunit L [Sphingobacteriia bacterium]|nr:NADH-quinone oxidoreductase subunit L [Sphingobacteriia bacterium]
MQALLPLIILSPIFGAAIIGIWGLLSPSFRKQEKFIGSIATAAVLLPFLLVLQTFLQYEHGHPVKFELFSWMAAGSFSVNFSYVLDEASLLMGLIVTGIGALIHIYSIAYMHGDKGFYRYFLYLNLFIFSMNNLILGDNLLVLFLGWEGVGACSYFLIGYWFEDMAKAMAAQKAFVANRIGDFALLIAIFIIFATNGTLTFSEISLSGDAAFWVALLVFIAATGKSAQLPLYVWLPDAMAGPTPVSALIHAATMVTSGIYLIARMSDVFLQVPGVMLVVAIIGGLTAILAALIAIAQNDIKKVLAYSTVSQLGFMFMALGAGAYSTAIFHVMTHAFFKACLFLGSGSVIHAMEHMHVVDDPQDVRTMGHLGKYMPHTSKTFWISTLAIAGIFPLSGFFSKDEILGKLFAAGHSSALYYGVWGVGMLTAVLTAFYMTRVTYLTFNGKKRFPESGHPHESSPLMTIPLWILAICAVLGGFLGLPAIIGHGEFNWISEHWLSRHEGATITNAHLHADLITEYILIGISFLVAIGGVLFARNLYARFDLQGDLKVRNFFGGLYRVMENKFFVDEFYNATFIRPFVWFGNYAVMPFDKKWIDGAVNGSGAIVAYAAAQFRYLQSGLVQKYALIMFVGVIILLGYVMFA